MRNRSMALVLALPMIAFGSSLASPTAAQDSTCGVPSSEAVGVLPTPLSKWGQILCTDTGQVITGHDGWVWVEPTHRALVIIPSQNLRTESGELKQNPEPDKAMHESGSDVGKSYFTKIEFTKVAGEEFDTVYKIFHSGFDENDGKPAAYRLDLKTISGKEIRLYMFDYFTYAWGMACSPERCDPSSRFVMLNTNEDPKKLPQPI
jgi:hypothetical protein